MNVARPESGNKSLSSLKDRVEGSRDMIVILFWTALCIASIFTPYVNQSFIRLFLSLPLILFIPGYVLLVALFPDKVDIDTVERMILSIGVSIIVTPLIGLVLNFTEMGIRLESVLFTLALFILVMVIIATTRRLSVDPELRYVPSLSGLIAGIQSECTRTENSARNRILLIGSILAVCLVIFSVFVAIYIPKPGDKFTEFYILGENRTADSYPDLIHPGTNHTLFVGIGNHEFRSINYSFDVYLVSVPANISIDEISPSQFSLLKTDYVILQNNETSITPVVFSVPETGRYRIDLMLFNETPDLQLSKIARGAGSYRNLHIWINATSAAAVMNNT